MADETDKDAEPLTDEEIGRLRDTFTSGILTRALATIDALTAENATLREEVTEAMRELAPVCKDETLIGAIRNLKQAHISERDNAEKLERALSSRPSDETLGKWAEEIETALWDGDVLEFGSRRRARAFVQIILSTLHRLMEEK